MDAWMFLLSVFRQNVTSYSKKHKLSQVKKYLYDCSNIGKYKYSYTGDWKHI